MNAVARCWRAALSRAAFAVPLLTSAISAASEPVDVELVLAVDTSSSMKTAELRRQRVGCAAAFRSSEVIDAIRGGLHGRVAVTYVEWGVIGRPRSFMLPVSDWDHFPAAVRRKLVFELAGDPVTHARAMPAEARVWKVAGGHRLRGWRGAVARLE